MTVDLPKHVVSVVLDGEESCLEFIEEPSTKVGIYDASATYGSRL